MARHPKFTVSDTPRGWKVNVPMSLSSTGKRQELFFPSRDKAAKKAAELRENHRQHGAGANHLPPAVADDAMRAWSILGPLDMTLTAAAREVAARIDRESASLPLGKALDAWEAANEARLRKVTFDSYKATGKLLRGIGAETMLSALTGARLADAIAGKSAAFHRRNASAMLRWCAKPPRKWCDAAAIMAEVEVVSTHRDGEIETLMPKDVSALLKTAQAHFPEAVCMYVVALFGGLRKEELAKLTKEAVTSQGIEVCAAIAKKRRRRFVPMSKTLRAWLVKYPFTPCPSWVERDKAVRRLAGWAVESRMLERPPEPTRGPWPRNALRHTHASAEIAGGATLEDLLFRFGHTDGPDMLRSHYVGRYSPAQAKEFFALRP